MTESIVNVGTTEAREALDRPPAGDALACYVYAVVPAEAAGLEDFHPLGLDGCPVRVVVQGRIGALVHDCSARPYESGGEAAEASWVLAHHAVLQLAMATCGSVLPMTFNTIVAATDEKTADENLRDWLADEHGSLESRVDAMAGKAEFGLQVSYTPAAILRRVTDEVPEVKRLEGEARTASAGRAYLTRQQLERVVRRELEQRVADLFTAIYEGARACSVSVTVEKVKHADTDERMVANLSCLVARDRYPEIEALADDLGREEGQSARLVGPLPPYSFC